MNDKLPKNTKNLTRKSVLHLVSKSASYGNLGAFIGAGFSKAVINTSTDIALSWGELLKLVAKELNVNYKNIKKEGFSYPEIASKICEKCSDKKGISYSEALSLMKNKLSKLTSWYPDSNQRKTYSPYMELLNLSWIITTNYDLVIESLLTGRGMTIGPNEPLIAHAKLIPIFHLHGTRICPDEIVIAQEDYVGLFRPTEYRQMKLALTIKESTMLVLGYGLGDVNVLTALDWSKNVYKENSANYPNEVIQVIRKTTPKKQPYRDKNSIIILEVKSIKGFFEEFLPVREEYLKKEKTQNSTLKKLSEILITPNDSAVDKFIEDSSFRKENLKILSAFPNEIISSFIVFLNRCIDETWVHSEPSGAFHGYKENIEITLDILINLSFNQIPPALFQLLAYNLQSVGHFVGRKKGQSYYAHDIWKARKKEIPNETLSELKNFASQHGYGNLFSLC